MYCAILIAPGIQAKGEELFFVGKRGTKLLRAVQTHLYELIETPEPRVARPLHFLSERKTEKCQRAEEQPTELQPIHMEASKHLSLIHI